MEVESAARGYEPSALGSDAFAPLLVNRPPREHPGATLKIVEFNLRWGRRFEGIVECLRRPPLAGAHVLLLCEADWRHPRSFARRVAPDLAEALGMSFVYGPEFGWPRTDGPPVAFMGNAILCTQPLTNLRVAPMPNFHLPRRMRRLLGEPRGLIVTTAFRGRSLTLGVAHLNSRWTPAGREWQMRDYLDQVPAAGPTIIGGDFNTTTLDLTSRWATVLAALRSGFTPWRFARSNRYEPLFERLREAGFAIDEVNARNRPTFTHRRWIPPFVRPKLDWLAVRELEVLPGSAKVIPARRSFFSERVSDHDAIMCEVSL